MPVTFNKQKVNDHVARYKVYLVHKMELIELGMVTDVRLWTKRVHD